MQQLTRSQPVHLAVWFAVLLLASVLLYTKRPFNASSSAGVASVQHHYRIGYPTWLEFHDFTISISENGQVASTTQTLKTSLSIFNLALSLTVIVFGGWVLSILSIAFARSRKTRSTPGA